MCPIPDARAREDAPSTESQSTTSTCFTCTRLNASTFLIIEDDKWYEEPYIYVKVYASFLVLIDTGCGGAAKNVAAELTSLREYIETFPVPDNNNQPLNPGSKQPYVVVCTHCHFDHIGATEQFNDDKSTIWAGSYDKSFLDKGRLSTTSLCRFMDMKTPEYTISHWADDGQKMTLDGKDLNLVIYHTPGHTPDQIAIWDSEERVIFVGDTMYERVPIVFPVEGNIRLYSETLEKLKTYVRGWNATTYTNGDSGAAEKMTRVKMACGHSTCAADAEELIDDVDSMLYRVMENLVPENDWGEWRGEPLIQYKREDGKINFAGPRGRFEEFRSDEKAMERLRERHSQM
ncbi:Metallo-hydrolase/oxidoreductase [Thozetella sp. PMI_491]|nr:Metallo-hydrolase/oxidoreductase [Thozetella sp. PMI_491]